MKQRIKEYLKYKGIKIIEFSATIGVSNAYVSSIKRSIQPDKLARIQRAYPDLNIEWLVTGVGNMLNTSSGVNVINNGTNSGTMGNNIVTYHGGNNATDNDEAEDMEVEEIPVVPRAAYLDPDTDIVDYINNNDVRMSPRVKQFPEYDLWLPMYTDTMVSKYIPGDKLAAKILQRERPKIYNGRVYAVETTSNMLIFCYLTQCEGGYIASYENKRYADDFIPYEDISRIFRIVGGIRIE